MGYQVLARKWRPRSFKELVGQAHVLQALVNALNQDRLHHAYLFTGTRGVGKTTIARIFAKCLNCEKGVSSTPCDECVACIEINEGRFVDLIEVDAASRTKVEDTRELLDNVQYAPTTGRYKVYLIDEVHMLSTHSFNALLKTLEEPPPHVKFLLATTDPQKLPVTILSRCLQFSLKNMAPERIVGYLETVLTGENIEYDTPALWQIAISADGSMRDALSLADQAIAFGNGRICETEVRAMLGTIDRGQVMRMVRALASADAGVVIEAVSELAYYGPDYLTVLDDMLSMLHRVAIAQAVPDAIDNSLGDREKVLELASVMRAEDVQLYYQVGLVGKKDLPLAPSPRSGFEMAMLRMLAFRPDSAPLEKGVLGAGFRDSTDGDDGAGESEQPAEPEPALPVESVVDQQRFLADGAADEESGGGEYLKEVEEHIPLSAYDEAIIPAELNASSSEVLIDEGNDLLSQPDNDKGVAQELAHAASEVALLDAKVEDKKLTLTDLNASSWVAVFRGLALGGVTGTLGSHCEYVAHSANTMNLRLDSKRSTLYDEMHRERIEKVLSDYFDKPLSLQVEVGAIETETPADWRDRNISERLEQAKRSIYNDPNVRLLISDFSATVLDESIEPVGNIIS
ncbi:MAG: DNA polymerase III subunit gamma/tau [Candidatus Endonucleobacter sp. (ex Gigantidas childressi)]|nr:DNA polymerase III subunit gamma/tau [Candidatus Endonucleobacter sp. (ex Gigantidas childressi)]